MNEQQLSDLVTRAADDADALQCLIVHHHAEMRGVVVAEMDGRLRGRFDPEDILQQVYVSVLSSLPEASFEGPAHFRNWLRKIVLARLADTQRALRRQRRDVAREVFPAVGKGSGSYADLVQRVSAADTQPARRLGRDEAVAAVMSCLARLNEDQREVVRLRVLEDVPVEEIARRMGKTKTAVYTLCHRGLKSLRERMVSISRFLTRL